MATPTASPQNNTVTYFNSLWLSDTTHAWWVFVNIGSGNGLLPDGIKPSPEPMLTYHQYGPIVSTSEQFHGNVITKSHLKIKHLNSQPLLPGDNELTIQMPLHAAYYIRII